MQSDGLYRIGELAKAARVSRRTVDFYTRMGLVTPEERTEGNYRLYGEDALKRLLYIQELKKRKYTLEEIRDRLDAMDRQTPPSDTVHRMEKLQELMKQLETELSDLRPELRQCATRLSDSFQRTTVQRALAQGLSLAQALLLFIYDSQWLNL
ncbi:transcriptional regulator [Kyrpidia spormannii]|uniref:Transcriptional regulator n=1 Tax=Kyrpidia spormannii TaxID=2055160 RepID=A0A2K8N9P1_9BACL|nr:MerR family transcriptional regulator [Kyrpidia spormannii]ATY85517.1 transcriptional regulator [Kyrpidia spormannii]